MLWVLESEGFFLESLQKQTHYRELLRMVPDDVFLDELAEDLTVSCITHAAKRGSIS